MSTNSASLTDEDLVVIENVMKATGLSQAEATKLLLMDHASTMRAREPYAAQPRPSKCQIDRSPEAIDKMKRGRSGCRRLDPYTLLGDHAEERDL